MDKLDMGQLPLDPKDYWKIGPVYIWKWLFLLALAGLSVLVLLLFGLPTGLFSAGGGDIPTYRYDDPKLLERSGVVRVLDSGGTLRYEGEVAQGAYTGMGRVYDAAGQLLYDGPLADGVYEGAEARVYRAGTLVYTGEMAQNRYQGQGRRTDPETGIISEGQFSNGQLEGAGREFYPDGSLLREGTFSRDLLEGEGREYSRESVLLREGTFSEGLLHGTGTAYASGGALLYTGEFQRGVYHGQGVQYDALLSAPIYEGTFAAGVPTGSGSIYHPSGQLLYTGPVYDGRPRGDAFLGLSLAQVEEAFTSHWLLYLWEDRAAFVFPYFQLMFLTQSPLEVVSPTRQEAQAARDQQALNDLQQAQTQVQADLQELLEGLSAQEDEARAGQLEQAAALTERLETQQAQLTLMLTQAQARQTQSGAEDAAGGAEPPVSDELLSPETDKSSIVITQVLSYGRALAGAAQPDFSAASGAHGAGWREWFADHARDGSCPGAVVSQSGQFIYRFTPSRAGKPEEVEEFLAEGAGVETTTVLRADKDASVWYQTAVWKEEP